MGEFLQATKTASRLSFSIARKLWSHIWPFLWFAAVVVLSLRLSLHRIFHTNGLLHFPGHALTFGFSAFAACRSARSSRQRLIRAAAVIAFGFVLEAAESRIFGKRLEWEDVLTDACGVFLFLLAAKWLDFRRKPRPVPGVQRSPAARP